jgi:DNA-binding transcriptional MerR regulator
VYTIRELSEMTGVSVRSIRKYIQLGLLPRATGRTSSARYGNQHVLRLRAITQAQERNVTLRDLKDRLG